MSIHINAKPGEIAPIVLMPGDPLRAKYMAEKFLQNVKLVSSTRNVYYFTGTYKDKPVTIGASGMGCPSIGIYSYELFNEYNVDCIIRIGTCGAYSTNLKLFDLVNVDRAFSESTYAKYAFGFSGDHLYHEGTAYAAINETAQELNMTVQKGAIHSSDIFYRSIKGIPAKATLLKQRSLCPANEKRYPFSLCICKKNYKLTTDSNASSIIGNNDFSR